MAHDVFISHSAKDKATADAVCAMLESEGIRCWIAPRDVLASMEWGEAIIDAIEQCRIMVLVFTANANASPQIRREIERAVNHGVAILPLRMEDVLPVKSLEYFIGNVHWLDALTPPLEAHLKNLAGTIKIVLARMEPREASPVQPAAAREVPEVVMPPEPAKAPPAVSTFSQAGASPNVESPFEPPLRQEPTAVDPVARAAAGDASETQHPAEVTDEPRVSTEESFRGVSRERPSIASWSREERGREGHSQASVGKLYLFGLLMLSACLIALGITWLTTPLGSSTFEGLSEQHRFFYFYFFKAAGAGLIVAGLGIAAIQKTRLPGAALAAILLSCSVLCTGLFFAGEIKNGWIWFVLDDSVGDFRKLALVGGALLICRTGIAAQRNGQPMGRGRNLRVRGRPAPLSGRPDLVQRCLHPRFRPQSCALGGTGLLSSDVVGNLDCLCAEPGRRCCVRLHHVSPMDADRSDLPCGDESRVRSTTLPPLVGPAFGGRVVGHALDVAPRGGLGRRRFSTWREAAHYPRNLPARLERSPRELIVRRYRFTLRASASGSQKSAGRFWL